jgi:small ligand-binding sensory domain FIST
MAIQEAVISITLPAAADLRTHQYKFVEVTSTGAVNLVADDGHADGVLLNDPNTGEAAIVQILGVAKVKCGAAVTRGGNVSSGANGAAKNADTSAAVLGTALETGASGRIISMIFHPRG